MRRTSLLTWLCVALLLTGCGTKKSSPKLELERARMLLERGELHDAINAFSRAMTDQASANDYYDRGVAYEQLGQLEQSAADYTATLRLSPGHTQALNNRGVVMAQLGRMEEALEDLTKAIEIDSQDALAWSNRGLAHHQVENYVDAISDYSQAIFIQPEARLYFQRGNVYLDFDKPQQAIQDYTDALKLDKSLVRAFVNRGNAHSQLGNYQAAIADLRQANELDRELSMAGAIEQLEQQLRKQQWQSVAAQGLQGWLATEGYEIRSDNEKSDLRRFTFHPTGDAEGIPCLITPMGPRGAPVFAAELAEELVAYGKELALLVIDKPQLIASPPQNSSEAPLWLKDWRFRWRPVDSDFIPSEVEILLGPPVE